MLKLDSEAQSRFPSPATGLSSLRKNLRIVVPNPLALLRNASFLEFQPKRDSSLRSKWRAKQFFPQSI
jgi:hypothetical protein